MTNTLSKSGIAAHAGGVDHDKLLATIDIKSLKDMAEMLAEMENNLSWLSSFEWDASRQMAVELARLEIHRLAQTYSHAALQLGLKASLAMEEGE